MSKEDHEINLLKAQCDFYKTMTFIAKCIFGAIVVICFAFMFG